MLREANLSMTQAMVPGRMTVLLCGNIASGKSLAAQFLRAHGAVVIDLDEVGHALLREDAAVIQGIAQRFGDEVLINGMVDRRRLARVAFADAKSIARLNELMHPRIYQQLCERLNRLDSSASLVVIECSAGEALGRFSALANEVLLITAPIELRKQRAIERGMMEADVEARMKIQPSEAELIAQADTIIENKGSQAEFIDHLSQWFERIVTCRDRYERIER